MPSPTHKPSVAEAVIAAEAVKAGVRYNQEFAITYAADYEFHGAIAQLGERLTGSQEAEGSSPSSSTE
jgi:hypothetical protein